LPEGFRYASDTNSEWLTKLQLQELIASLEPDNSTIPV
jgi:hypothetical protein